MIDKRNDFTLRLLTEAGIKKGMHVLDVGCGSGEVTMLLADLVGSQGEVLGFDISENAIVTARNTASEKELSNVKFISAEICNLPHDLKQFDAIVGRRVLMYQPDAVSSLRALLPFLKTGGLMVFQESDAMGSGMVMDKLPLHTQVQSWIWDTVLKENGNIHMGLDMYSTFTELGLKVQLIKSEAVLQTAEMESDLPWVVKMMLPRIIESGVATLDEIQIDTLEERLLIERQKAKTVFIRDMVFGICGIK